LILSNHASFNSLAAHSVMAMITSAQHARWPLDVPISDLAAAGLPVASLVRFKLFTLDHRLVRGILGHLSDQDAGRVTKSVRKLFI
jgi:mRNA interferase MazF